MIPIGIRKTNSGSVTLVDLQGDETVKLGIEMNDFLTGGYGMQPISQPRLEFQRHLRYPCQAPQRKRICFTRPFLVNPHLRSSPYDKQAA